MSQLAFLLLVCVVFLIPLEAIARVPVLSPLSELVGSVTRTIGIVAFAAGVASVIARRSFRRLSLPLVLTALFGMWAAATMLWTIDSVATIARVRTYVQLVMFVWLLWELTDSRERQQMLLQSYVLGAYASAVTQIASFASGSPLTAGRYTALGADVNDLGTTIALGLPMAWYLSLISTRGIRVWLNRLFVPVGVLCVFLTGSRGALIAACVAISIIPWTVARAQLKVRTITVTLAIAMLSVYGVVTLVPPESWQRYSTLRSDLVAGDYTGRGRIWRAGLEVFRQEPILGVGAGTISIATLPLLDRERSAHNGFLAVLVEQGIIGFTIFGSILAAVLLGVWLLPSPDRQFGVVLAVTLVVALLPLNWDYVKQTWFVLGFLPAFTANARSATRATRELSTRSLPALEVADWHRPSDLPPVRLAGRQAHHRPAVTLLPRTGALVRPGTRRNRLDNGTS